MRDRYPLKGEFDDEVGNHIKNDLLSAADQIEPPFNLEQWEKIVRHHGLRKQRKTWLKKVSLTAAAILILSMSISLLKPSEASALGERLLQSLKVFLGGSLYNINTAQEENPTPPIVKRNEFPTEKEMTLDEIENTVYFSIAQPEYLPPGTVLKNILLTKATEDIYSIKMQYAHNKQSLILIQNNSIGDFNNTFLYDSDDAQVEKIDINGREAYLIELKDGSTILRWTMRGLELELMAKVNKDELLKIAKSVK